MSSTAQSPTVWLVDPISYSGMAYTDVGQIIALRELGAHVLLVGSDSWMLEPGIVPRIAMFRGTCGPRSRLQKGLRYIGSLVRLVMKSRYSRPDILHWQFTELPIADVLAMFAIRVIGIRQVYTAHELLPWSARSHHRWLFSRLYGLVDAIIVHNNNQRAEMIRGFSIAPSKVNVAPLGDYALFATPRLPQSQARARLDLPDDMPVALFFGAIRPSKGLEVLLDAWPLVTQRLPDAILVVTGKPFKGLDATKMVDRIMRLGIESKVRTKFEQVGPEETNDHYRAADVVVLPYHEIGTSGVLRYAYNSARPVIATAVGEHRERVIPGHTGQLVPPDNPIALADALIYALRDRAKLHEMGENARLYAAATMSWKEPAREMLRTYENLRQK